MINLDFDWDKAGREYIENMPNKLKESLIDGIKEAMFAAEGYSKEGFDPQSWTKPPNPPPGPLVSRTEDLRDSVEASRDVKQEGGSLVGYIESTLGYAEMHEFGGENDVGLEVPPRPFLLPAITNNLDEIRNIIAENIIKGLNK